MKRIVLVVALVLAAAAGWFFLSPLFIDRQVNESFDFTGSDGQFNLEGVMAMPAAKRMEMKDEIMAAAAGAPDVAMSEPMADNAPTVLAQGRFVDADAVHSGSGDAILYQLPDGGHLVRFENFRTTNGPALVVYLAKHPDPKSADDVTEGGYLNLGKLKGNVGNQNYPVPAGTAIEEYQSVVVWCELFGVLFSPAALVSAREVSQQLQTGPPTLNQTARG